MKNIMEAIEETAIDEKELKLLWNFVKDNLQEAKETKDEETEINELTKHWSIFSSI